MKTVYHLTICFCLVACKEHSNSSLPEKKKDKAEISETDFYRKAYDIADLKSYKDTSKFIGRFTITKRYNNTFFIEVDEIANGINLCVKQPVVYLPDFKYYDTIRSLPFNQLCYWYADKDVNFIKNTFLNYENDKNHTIIECSTCLDPETWTIEIYNKGRYSSITKDHLRGDDSIFVNMLYDKVRMYKKNNYTIKY